MITRLLALLELILFWYGNNEKLIELVFIIYVVFFIPNMQNELLFK